MKRWYNIVVKVRKNKKIGNLQSDIKTSCTVKRKKKIGGVPSSSIYCRSLDFPWSFPALLGQELALPCPSSWSPGGGACCADSQVCAPGAGLSGSCLPLDASGPWRPLPSQARVIPGGTTTLPGASSPALDQVPQ